MLSLITPGAPVTLSLHEAVGTVLAADTHARLAVPPFSNSGMDGYLINTADLSAGGTATLKVSGDVPAGGGAALTPARGESVRIMTGAPVSDPVPEGLAVIPVEDTSSSPGPLDLPESIDIHAFRGRAHIRLRGENVRPGDRVARAGELIDAGTLAGLISAGVEQVSSFPRPRVAVLSSGDELVTSGTTPLPGQIPDSNRPMVAQLIREAGIKEVSELHTGDDPEEFQDVFSQVVESHDLVITTGGVSAGAFDVVKSAMGQGAAMWFGHVSMQPGKPQGAGTWARRDGSPVPVLCLPGNPVAAFVSFLMFVRAAVDKLVGLEVSPDLGSRPRITATAAVDFPDARAKDLIVPVRLSWGEAGALATPFTQGGRGSHFVASLNGVDGFAIIPPGSSGPGESEQIGVYLT